MPGKHAFDWDFEKIIHAFVDVGKKYSAAVETKVKSVDGKGFKEGRVEIFYMPG